MATATQTGYKLFRQTKNGLRSLFIDRTRPLPEGVWLRSKPVRTNGYAYRPGWHVLAKPCAPHLSKEKREMRRVEMRGIMAVHNRPKSQGGTWYTAREIRIL